VELLLRDPATDSPVEAGLLWQTCVLSSAP
jgi:hypothetical protein